MSIVAEKISKRYGKQLALNQVSFSIEKGEIVGFLGPNGAGKSTMMKILTCYIPPTEGMASVCNFDVMEKSIEAKRMIGYLPEHNPFYTDMYVREYLSFVAGIYHVTNKTKRVEEMIEMVGLGIEAHKKIEALSKGYRQRVGLAQAMIHNPQVLILDEPTSGLDPNQLSEIRDLIIQIGKEKTVMLSTHIMQEVEAICNRTIIIHKGNIVADSPTAILRKRTQGSKYELFVEFSGDIPLSKLKQIKGISEITALGNNSYTLISSDKDDVRKSVSELVHQEGHSILSMTQKEQKLEDVFKELTQPLNSN